MQGVVRMNDEDPNRQSNTTAAFAADEWSHVTMTISGVEIAAPDDHEVGLAGRDLDPGEAHEEAVPMELGDPCDPSELWARWARRA